MMKGVFPEIALVMFGSRESAIRCSVWFILKAKGC